MPPNDRAMTPVAIAALVVHPFLGHLYGLQPSEVRLAELGRAEAQSFGILDLRGLWFVRGNLVRDLAAFAKRELLPWDGWGLMAMRDDGDAAAMALLDRVADLTLASDDRHAERIELQRSHPGLRVPAAVLSFNLGGASVSLAPGIAN